jgi:hypothetical protein
MKGPPAVVAAVAAAVIAAAAPASRSEAYPGASCFHNCNAAYGMCEYRGQTPRAECRRRLSGCTKQCYQAYYRDWKSPSFEYFHPRQRFKAIPRTPKRLDGVRIPSKSRVTPYSLRVR